jgi:hypothetical protein
MRWPHTLPNNGVTKVKPIYCKVYLISLLLRVHDASWEKKFVNVGKIPAWQNITVSWVCLLLASAAAAAIGVTLLKLQNRCKLFAFVSRGNLSPI